MSDQQRIRIGEFVSICPRGKKNCWTAEFSFNGVHRRQTLKTSNLRIARSRAAAIDRELAEGTFGTAKAQRNRSATMKVDTAIDEFISHCETEGCRRRTRTKYAGILKKFALFAVARNATLLSEVDLSLVDGYRAFRKPLLSAKSMHHEGTTLKRFLAWAKSRNHISANPLADSRFTLPRQQPRGGPSLDQVDAILAAAPERYRPMLAMLAFAGLRSGEMQRALIEDIDLGDGWIRVISRPGAETKTGDSRKVPIHPRLRSVLERVSKRRTGYFFTADPSRRYPAGGHYINTKRLNEAVLEILKSLEIPAGRDAGMTTHSLRHFFRTFTTNAGVPERAVDVWLGHASDRSMASVYYKLDDQTSQSFMSNVPFGENMPSTDGEKGE